MSQNGPWPGTPSHPWSRGSDEPEPYAEPADPWGDPHAAESSWDPASSPAQPYGSLNGPPPGWGEPPPPPPPRRNTLLVALVIVLAALAAIGLTTSVLLLDRRGGDAAARGPAAASSAPVTSAAPGPAALRSSADARFVRRGQCVSNEGTTDAPVMTVAVCGAGTYQVLKRIDGRTTGQADAEAKCGKVPGYTKWYFYDSELDSLDFVLCLKER